MISEKIKDNALNCVEVLLCWSAFITWCVLIPNSRFRWPGLLLTPLVCLAFQQSIAGFVHEAAHFNLIRGNRRLNEIFGNVFGSFLLFYDLDSFRFDHFRHHSMERYFVREDRETFNWAVPRSQITSLWLKDLFGITALKMFLVRSSPGKLSSTRALILIHFVLLWGPLAYFGSPLYPLVFFGTLVSLYPLTNGIRTWAFHADLLKSDGAQDSPVARNVHSPFYERIFFGTRYLMYHYDHHLQPGLPFRGCQKSAKARRKLRPGPESVNQQCSSYLVFTLQFFRGQFVGRSNSGTDQSVGSAGPPV